MKKITLLSGLMLLAATGLLLWPSAETAHRPLPDVPAALAGELHSDLSPDHVRQVMQKVADAAIATPPPERLLLKLIGETDTRQWIYATFYLGMAALAEQAADDHYWDYLRRQAELNQWQLTDELYHADSHLVGSLYLALARHDGQPDYYRMLQDHLAQIVATPSTSTSLEHPPTDLRFLLFESEAMQRWIWADALFMAPATWMELSNQTGDPRYREFADREFWVMHELLFDTDEALYYRDSRFVDMRTEAGGKIFWSRGNGWVIAGIARILQQLPADHPSRPRYEALFKTVAMRLQALQGRDGYWPSSLLPDPQLTTPESSGTALITFALAWGINAGLLEDATVRPAVTKGWQALVNAIHRDGRLGWVQAMGDRPATASFADSNLYAAGALLLAGSEIFRLPVQAAICPQTTVTVQVSNNTAVAVVAQPLEISANTPGLAALLGCADKVVTVRDRNSSAYLLNQALDLDGDTQAEALLVQLDMQPGQHRTLDLGLAEVNPLGALGGLSLGRIVPERDDDFVWENNRIAYRLYGPALQRQGEISSGVDVWGKRVGRNVVNDWYANGRSLLHNYHRDQGEGADFFEVNTTLGAGSFAWWQQQQLAMPPNFTRARVLTQGPLRVVFELDYDQWSTPLGNLPFTSRVTLDRNWQLFKTEISWRPSAPFAKGTVLPLALGFTRSNGEPAEVQWQAANGVLSNWFELGDDWGQLGLAMLVPAQTAAAVQPVSAAEHDLLVGEFDSTQPLIYFAGGCWSKSRHCSDDAQWRSALQRLSAQLNVHLDIALPQHQPIHE